MACNLCMCVVCKCEYRQQFYCQKFKFVVKIQNDQFWKLSVCQQAEKLSQCIDLHQKDRAIVRKEAVNVHKPPACDILHTMDHQIWLLDKLRQTIILNNTDQVPECDLKSMR